MRSEPNSEANADLSRVIFRDEVIKKTAGYIYNNGGRTVEDFQGFFGVNPREYPDLWRITDHGIVIQLPAHEERYQKLIAEEKRNWRALGINS